MGIYGNNKAGAQAFIARVGTPSGAPAATPPAPGAAPTSGRRPASPPTGMPLGRSPKSQSEGQDAAPLRRLPPRNSGSLGALRAIAQKAQGTPIPSLFNTVHNNLYAAIGSGGSASQQALADSQSRMQRRPASPNLQAQIKAENQQKPPSGQELPSWMNANPGRANHTPLPASQGGLQRKQAQSLHPSPAGMDPNQGVYGRADGGGVKMFSPPASPTSIRDTQSVPLQPSVQHQSSASGGLVRKSSSQTLTGQQPAGMAWVPRPSPEKSGLKTPETPLKKPLINADYKPIDDGTNDEVSKGQALARKQFQSYKNTSPSQSVLLDKIVDQNGKMSLEDKLKLAEAAAKDAGGVPFDHQDATPKKSSNRPGLKFAAQSEVRTAHVMGGLGAEEKGGPLGSVSKQPTKTVSVGNKPGDISSQGFNKHTQKFESVDNRVSIDGKKQFAPPPLKDDLDAVSI
jgi:hypothetical protein